MFGVVPFLILTIMDAPFAAPALALLAGVALAGCTEDDGPGAPVERIGSVEREARAAELLAPREDLSLTDVRWLAEAAVLPGPGKLPLASGLVFTIEFDAGGKRARGHDGCGAHERGYRRDGDALTLSAPTERGPAPCGLSELGTAERGLVEALLATAERHAIRGDRLLLESPDGASLVLRGQRLDAVPEGLAPGIEPEFVPGEPVPFAVLERSEGLNLGERAVSVPERFVAVHDARAFEALWRNAHSFDPGAPAPAFDFDLGSVVAAFSPLRPSLGHAIRIDAIEASGGTGPEDGHRVLVTTVLPGPGCAVAEVMSVPYEIVGVPTLVVAPRFEERTVEGAPCD